MTATQYSYLLYRVAFRFKGDIQPKGDDVRYQRTAIQEPGAEMDLETHEDEEQEGLSCLGDGESLSTLQQTGGDPHAGEELSEGVPEVSTPPEFGCLHVERRRREVKHPTFPDTPEGGAAEIKWLVAHPDASPSPRCEDSQQGD